MHTAIRKPDTARLESLLYNLYCPFLEAQLGELGALGRVAVSSAGVEVDLHLGAHLASLYPAITQWLTRELEGFVSAGVGVRLSDEVGVPTSDGVGVSIAPGAVGVLTGKDKVGVLPGDEVGVRINVRINVDVPQSAALARHGKLHSVRNLLLVASGKGGVGKSTTAINLALALSAEGARVGVLDADIYGPSLPTMLGIAREARPEVTDGARLRPLRRYGLATMSVAYLMEQDGPVIWRGPLAVKALQQLLELTDWGDLDYLIVDMPPGTGDIHLSLAQKVQVSAGLVVTTPQEMALADARKGLEMFERVHIPVLGIVENMATHVCTRCGHEESIFGCGGAHRLAVEHDTTVLASLPLEGQIREHTDDGRPTVVQAPASRTAQVYRELAHKVAVGLWKHNLAASALPEICISG